MAQPPSKPPSTWEQVTRFEGTLGRDVVTDIERAVDDYAEYVVEAWAAGVPGEVLPWSDRQFEVARAELGDVFGDFEAGLRRCRPEERERWVQAWADEHVSAVGLAVALEEAISGPARFQAQGLRRLVAMLENKPAPGLEIKDCAPEVSGLGPGELRNMIDDLGPLYDGLPAAEEWRQELVARREQIVAAVVEANGFESSTTSAGDTDAARWARWERALKELDGEIRAADEQLEGVDQETMDTAARLRAARKELARQEYGSAMPVRPQQQPARGWDGSAEIDPDGLAGIDPDGWAGFDLDAALDNRRARDLEVKDCAREVSGLGPGELRGLIDEIGPLYDGLPAAEKKRQELVGRRERLVEAIDGFEPRIAVSERLGDDAKADTRSALKSQWERALAEVDRNLRDVNGKLEGVDQEAMDTAAMLTAARRELARHGHELDAPDLPQQAAEPPGRDAAGLGIG
jgi:hypothetical protein